VSDHFPVELTLLLKNGNRDGVNIINSGREEAKEEEQQRGDNNIALQSNFLQMQTPLQNPQGAVINSKGTQPVEYNIKIQQKINHEGGNLHPESVVKRGASNNKQQRNLNSSKCCEKCDLTKKAGALMLCRLCDDAYHRHCLVNIFLKLFCSHVNFFFCG
jgi:hypothetical protein